MDGKKILFYFLFLIANIACIIWAYPSPVIVLNIAVSIYFLMEILDELFF